MRVLILSDANSIHTVRWVKGLNSLGIIIGLWSINEPNKGLYDDCKGVKVYHSRIKQERSGFIAKLKYLTLLSSVKKSIQDFKPDILHAHYASSFGLLGSLMGFTPFLISVWGSDIYDFPTSNLFFNKIIKFNLNCADKILSTSHIMALETKKYTNKSVEVIPFGIDLEIFKKNKVGKNSKKFVVGTIKTLEEKYGIKYLIQAFNIFHQKYPNVNKELLIVGGGSLEKELITLVNSLGIGNICTFTGKVPYSEVPKYHNLLDVCCCLSVLDSESFGVAAIESSAVENPVIVSKVGGLKEVIVDGETGIVVPQKDPVMTSEAIEILFLDKSLRKKMGINGRKRVECFYDWNKNLTDMLNVYLNVIGGKKRCV